MKPPFPLENTPIRKPFAPFAQKIPDSHITAEQLLRISL
jgi:hypothetical protein